MRLKIIYVVIIVLALNSCGKKHSSGNRDNEFEITDVKLQDSLFKNLLSLTGHTLTTPGLEDSLAFLILPTEASCPACRNKTIDSIDKYKTQLGSRRFIVISGKGRKSIAGYFKQLDKKLPDQNERIFLDTTDQAFKSDLTIDNPNIYYTYNRKVYKKISCTPRTIRGNLRGFFVNSK